MCEQCLTNAVLLVRNVVPGFSLMQATQDGQAWKHGQYALVEQNDPSFILTGPLIADPAHGMSDETINALSEAAYASHDPYYAAMDRLGEDLRRHADPLTSYRLVKACIEAGYDTDNDGFLEHWLLHTMATQAQGAVPVHHGAHVAHEQAALETEMAQERKAVSTAPKVG